MLILLTLYELCMSKNVQYMQGCTVPIRHIISTSEDVQYKQVNHQVLAQEGTTQKYFPMIYQVKYIK